MQTIQQLIQAIEKTPNDPGLYYELGGLYLESHNTQAALTSYLNALQLAPNHPQILLQLGNTASAAQHYEQAIQYFQQCIQVDQTNAAAYYNLGNAYMALGQSNHAVTQFKQSLKYHPNDADAYNNLGNALRDLGKLDEAIDCYTQALAINPHLHHALVHRIHQQQHICNWQGLNDDIARLRNLLISDPKAQIAPFAFLAMPNTSAEELLCASQWAQQQFGHLQALLAISTRKANAKIKVAYLSADFRLHPLAFLITELLAAHDRTRFEIHAYSYGPDDNSHERQQIEANVDHFVDIRQLTDQQAAEHMRAQAIDILVDLTGYTKHSRTSIVALKPAPISINWLGYPGTMGYLDTTRSTQHRSVFDYILVDHTIAPNSENYSETCLYLPCYQPNNAQRPIGETPSKSAFGIPDGAFVFCCFNQTFKITEDVFKVWMQLLNQVPNSVLWLLACNQWAKKNLLAYAQQAGVAAERILFAPRVPIQDHLARHVHADLFLDTLPYNAHTTASDALWMDVPVLTCIGNTFPSRVAASLLTSLNLQSLVTDSLQDYATRALTLAQDKTALVEIKQQIQAQKISLFNPKLFVQGLESAYIHVYNKIP
jgi:protein O-GlcNAc transferase